MTGELQMPNASVWFLTVNSADYKLIVTIDETHCKLKPDQFMAQAEYAGQSIDVFIELLTKTE